MVPSTVGGLWKRVRNLSPCVALAVALATVSPALGASFTTFESGHVRPLALSPDGARLYAVNTPDAQLEVFDVSSTGLTRVASVPVGLEPVAVAARNNSEVWVVNHLSDSVSIVDVSTTPPRVTRTLLVGDEPRDIVFAGAAGNRAFITTAHRGQNSPVDPQLTTPGVGRADVWVFSANSLGSTLGGTPLTIITLFGDTPRALAASPDGSTVYAAVFHSGNRTTAISEGVVCDGGSTAGPCVIGGFTMPGGSPGPDTDIDGIPHPETGLVVKFNTTSNHWEDELGRNWDNAVRFSLPDKDVFTINATATPPVATGTAFTDVGTILFNMIVNPTNGAVYVTNTDARNEVRFEGPGIFGGTTVRGHLHEARVTVLSGSNAQPRHLNKHINYNVVPSSKSVAQKSLATPLGMAVSSDGTTLYVAAFGSSKIGVFDTAALESDSFVPSTANQITVSGGGPTAVVLDEPHARLYVLTRFDNALKIIDPATRKELGRVALHSPEPAIVKNGRRFLYDAAFTSSNGEAACAACHIFGDFDSLAWDLGNPDDAVLNNPNPFRLGPLGNPDFHPMKGPMTTQSLRGMAAAGPMHWRGDRTGGNDSGGSALDEDAAFKKFNVAFEGLLGRSKPLTDSEMQAFTDFILEVTYPPNPIRALDNSLTSDQQAGRNFYFNGLPSDTFENCNGCHVLDAAAGSFGTDGLSSFENEPQHLKVPHLRNMYQKVGMFGMPAISFIGSGDNGAMGDQIRGFGFLHDGSVDTQFRFHNATVFNQSIINPGGIPAGAAGDPLRSQLEQFMFAFDSNLAPIVGQQVTLTNTNPATVGARIDLLIARAAAGECDLVVKGTVAGEPRGAYRTSSGSFQPDRVAQALLSDAAIRALAATAGQEATYTCVPPGAGVRAGVDRDDDGVFDGDELDAGSDPGSALSEPIACTTGGTIAKPIVKVSKNADPTGDESLSARGEWSVATLSPAIDPIANGFNFKVADLSGSTLFDCRIPPGTPASKGQPGWAVNSKGTTWTYKDTTGSSTKGITKVVVTDSTSKTPGLYKFTIAGKKADFQVGTSEAPVQLFVVLGGVAQDTAGQCATVAFNGTGGPVPSCTFSGGTNTLSCR